MKDCNEPTTSYGVILIKLDNILNDKEIINELYKKHTKFDINTKGIKIRNFADLEIFHPIKDNIKFLMVQRRHSLGYVEFIRGRYKADNIDGIIFLFQQMSQDEIDDIGKYDFDVLWKSFWDDEYKKDKLMDEYEKSKKLFNKLKNNEFELGLDYYVKCVKPNYSIQEWGFPKGRRNGVSKNNLYETDIMCAKREFEEETGYNDDEYIILDGFQPLIEIFIGTNGIKYKHVYYLGLAKTEKNPKIEDLTEQQKKEVGDIGFFSYNDSINIIRNYHKDKQKILTKIYMLLLENIIKIINKTETDTDITEVIE